MSKQIYSKSYNGISDFIYVDLLPEVKRSRQFNVNVIAALFLGVVLSFILIYMPFRTATVEFEELNALNNDLVHELRLTGEEFEGYEIDLENIAFEEDIEDLTDYQVNFNNFLDDVELLADFREGTIVFTSFSADSSELLITVVISSPFTYSILNNDFLELPWVDSCDYSEPTRTGDAALYSATFMLGVDRNAE